MSHALFANIVGWSGVTLGFAMTYFQYHRAKTIGIEGISLPTWSVFACTGIFWTSYGVAQHSLVIIAGSAVVFPLQLGIIRQLHPWRHRLVILRYAGMIAIASGLVTLAFGWSAGVLGTGVTMVFNRVPQIIELIRDDEVQGVSTSAWTIGVLCSALWVTFYVSEGLVAAIIVNVLALSGSAVIAGLAAWRQHGNDVRYRLANVFSTESV
jgi:uncharacterized protein with PQ loop repeat